MMRALGHTKRQQGFSLIEVLVTMVVVAIGLLGFAGLQAQSLKSNRTSLQRSYATMLAYDIVDCLRVNRAGANANLYNISLGTSAVAGTLAGNDLVAWKQALANALPAGDGSVNVNNGNVTVIVQWRENANPTAANIQFRTETSLW